VASIPEHRPEAAWRRVHELLLISAPRMNEKIADRSAGSGMPRPLWLLDAPLPLPDMQRHQSGLTLEEGPERIESGWWDGNGVARDYYVAHRARGEKLWVFQERQSKRWYLHGMFA
jgi:protein ImuB